MGRMFADPDLTPASFAGFSRQEIDADAKARAVARLQPVPPARGTQPMELAEVIGDQAVAAIGRAGQIVFHAVGDTGGIEKPEFQFAVADAMSQDARKGVSFWYHLGDVVYFFGQDQYYFAQFYDPYRDYGAPIFAIPGNHDAETFRGDTEQSLDGFVANFCSAAPQQSPDSQGAARTTMDQPGVYFALNAPFVKFIGLYSNTGEGATAGVIASSKIGDSQLTFLAEHLAAAKAERDAGQGRALVIATHHPPFTASQYHLPSPEMLRQIDAACAKAGIWPDLHLSGHAHLYERYTRVVGGKSIGYVVAGMGGYYNLNGLKRGHRPPPKCPQHGTDASGHALTLEAYNDTQFGFLRLTASGQAISGVFVTVDPRTGATGVGDTFRVVLSGGQVARGPAPARGRPSAAARPPRKQGGAVRARRRG